MGWESGMCRLFLETENSRWEGSIAGRCVEDTLPVFPSGFSRPQMSTHGGCFLDSGYEAVTGGGTSTRHPCIPSPGPPEKGGPKNLPLPRKAGWIILAFSSKFPPPMQCPSAIPLPTRRDGAAARPFVKSAGGKGQLLPP